MDDQPSQAEAESAPAPNPAVTYVGPIDDLKFVSGRLYARRQVRREGADEAAEWWPVPDETPPAEAPDAPPQRRLRA